jgi:hypothetical protein
VVNQTYAGNMTRRFRIALWALCVAATIVSLSVPEASAATATKRAVLTGTLGYDGGAYPGGFHPTAGQVQIIFVSRPLVLVDPVGTSGKFRTTLAPGSYTVTGCGPSSTGGPGLCSHPLTIRLKAGEVKHIQLVWAYVP